MAALFAIAVVVIGLIWAYRFNSALKSTPEAARKIGHRYWATQELRDAYEHTKKNPVDFGKHLPPKLERRYVIVGGSGLVGGDIVLQLLQRGQSPQSIRILDFSPLNRQDMLEKASGCDFVKTNITSVESVEAAFSKPWPSSVAKSPITVFHTAALIRPQERSILLYDRVSGVNRDGAVNVLNAAKKHGADVLIATSSASVSIKPVNFFTWPWQSSPKNYFQICDEKDFFAPIRTHEEFFANYAHSKAEAERAVCAANAPSFRTGCIRPGNAIYGQKTDPVLGTLLNDGEYVSWLPQVIQNYVSSRNVSLAHLDLEAALLSTPINSPPPACSGRPFVVTDKGPPITFWDMAYAAIVLSEKPIKLTHTEPIFIHMVAHIMEFWSLLLARFPFLTTVLGWKETSHPIHILQPATLNVSIHSFVDDSAARKPVAEGGIGYEPCATTLEGFCTQILEFNQEFSGAAGAKNNGGSKIAKVAKEAKGVAA
ncbi:hypothetical protein QBC35DRAFT_483499 [Podospora australis]|uniref:3-beta hydroxysteroid dehydrogenase/isomerase domain-containing protein n=1 Tax=Podospora australis TaxID=1536484 RepID=A0AAN6X2F5_9PEZI|nr:hypothetical protein QBC35DRAFT_483499 [Podospora australis]